MKLKTIGILVMMGTLTEGRHTLTLCIDNSKLYDISVDNLAHSYTNDTQIMWNGVLGGMELRPMPVISDVQVYPDVEADGTWRLAIPSPKLWSEFSPYLYTLSVSAEGESQTVSFGIRSFKAQSNRLLINGRPTFLRDTDQSARGAPRHGYRIENSSHLYLRLSKKDRGEAGLTKKISLFCGITVIYLLSFIIFASKTDNYK